MRNVGIRQCRECMVRKKCYLWFCRSCWDHLVMSDAFDVDLLIERLNKQG